MRRRAIIGGSVVVHLALLACVLLYHRDALLLTPYWVANGDSSKSYRMVYVPAGGLEQPPLDGQKFTFPHSALKRRFRARPRPLEQEPPEAEVAENRSTAGSPVGMTITGPISGHEVRLAFPLVFPDPPILRSELPQGLQGDVIVEVTIDAHGEVVETKVLQAIGHGLDEKVLATLRGWRFTPATLDGVPVASKHDVHFHFPS